LRTIGIGAAVAILACGCATPYQPRGASGGYEDFWIAPDQYQIVVTGNSGADRITLLRYLHRRADELCGPRGHTTSNVTVERHVSESSDEDDYEDDPPEDAREAAVAIAGSMLIAGIDATLDEEYAVTAIVTCLPAPPLPPPPPPPAPQEPAPPPAPSVPTRTPIVPPAGAGEGM
jgi:hypothetical protein